MKKLSISLIALAALALGACTSDDVALNNNGNEVAGGDGYISLAINLPTQTSTRAANDVYDDGIAAEYNVNDVTLYLFEGTSEATAVLSQTYSLTDAFEDYRPANDNITSRMQTTQKVTSPSTGSLYALVVVNGTGVTIPTGSTLSTLQSTITAMDVATIANVSGANFFMTNAPLWHGSKGGYTDPTTATAIVSDPDVTTLAEIDKSKIYDTQAQAEANPATEIYVERGVAKVTVDGSSATSGMTGVTVSVDGFVLDLTNLSGYIVRNTTTTNDWWQYASGTLDGVYAGANQYRFVGDVEVAADLYRTYWAIDPNYSTTLYTNGDEGSRNYPSTVLSLAGTTPTSLVAADGATGAYCLENTFNVAHQNQDETTRAIVAVTLTVEGAEEDGSFYTLEGDKSTLYTAAQVCAEVLSIFAADGNVEAAVKESWQGLEKEANDLYSYYKVTIDTSNGGSSDVTVSIALGDEVDYDVFASYFKDGIVPAILDPTDETGAFAAVVAAINVANEISYYAGGVAYYPVLIQHFGDDLTPWDITGVSGESYPNTNWSKTAEENWLGRYGVLRNNWYDITVTAVNQIGSADIPTAYGEPDDPIESWISVAINILSWAKRTQNVTL